MVWSIPIIALGLRLVLNYRMSHIEHAPKAFQTSEVQNKSLAVKGVPTDITEAEFKEFLDLNKISYAKAEQIIAI